MDRLYMVYFDLGEHVRVSASRLDYVRGYPVVTSGGPEVFVGLAPGGWLEPLSQL